jgi:uncharacterized protein YdgA (DUF945 family)
MRKLQGAIAALIVILLIVSPYAMGIWFQKTYSHLVSFYNTQNNLHVEITDYQRGWFGSEAVLNVEVTDPTVLQAFALLDPSQSLNLGRISFQLRQHISHGPIVYRFGRSLIYPVGLATIRNEMILSPELVNLFRTANVREPVLESSEDLVTFFGNLHDHFSLANVQFMHPKTGARFQFEKIQGDIVLKPRKFSVKGQIQISNFSLGDEDDVVMIPSMTMSFKQHRTPQGLWVGNSDWMLSAVSWKGKTAPFVSLSNIKWSGNSEENAGELHGSRQMNIEKIQVENQSWGPFELKISAQKLNAQAIVDLMTTYQYISQHGEMYRSQLQQKMSSMLPAIFNPGADIQLDTMNLITPFGELQMKGKIIWPAQNFTSSDDVSELLEAANLQLSVQISKQLTQQVMQFVAGLPYFQQLSQNEIRTMAEIQSEGLIALQQNALLISGLNAAKYLSKDDAALLLALQKTDSTGEKYVAEVKHLFLSKTITPEVAYILYLQYSTVQNQLQLLQQRLAKHQSDIQQQLQMQFDQWVQKKWIVQTGSDYSLQMTREAGVYQVNGRAQKSD